MSQISSAILTAHSGALQMEARFARVLPGRASRTRLQASSQAMAVYSSTEIR